MAAKAVAAALLALFVVHAAAFADEAISDFCVGDVASSLLLGDGFPCKPPANLTGDDFKFSLVPGVPGGRFRLGLSPAFAAQYPALNHLGIGAALLTFAEGGQTPPHTHNRASELFYVLDGALKVGFVSNAGVLFQTTVYKGDLFIFPKGLLHFQQNVGPGNATAFATLNSQNPGVQIVAQALLAATPVPIDDATIAQYLGVTPETVDSLRNSFIHL